ncbi:MAG: CPBP family intramembrane glutamic endopeptidase [Chthoniobacterales bacterium]
MTAENVTAGSVLEKRSWISRHRLVVFFALAYLLSWYPWIIALVRGRSSGPNPLGPLLAALIVSALAGGRKEVKGLLGRLVRARVGSRWYGFIVLLPLFCCLIATAITLLVTGSKLVFPSPEKLREIPDRFIFILLFIGLGEEPGWRGFALPALQRKHSPILASLILAPLWALWHAPLFGNEFPLPILPAFIVGLFGATLVQTWLFNRTRGSVLLQMLFHATVNTVGAGLIFPLFTGTPLIVLWWIYSGLWLATGVLLMRFSEGPNATEHPIESAQLRPADAAVGG